MSDKKKPFLRLVRAEADDTPDYSNQRTPLYSSHLERPSEDTEDFGERMKKIRASLEKIHQLMFELRKSSSEYEHTRR